MRNKILVSLFVLTFVFVYNSNAQTPQKESNPTKTEQVVDGKTVATTPATAKCNHGAKKENCCKDGKGKSDCKSKKGKDCCKDGKGKSDCKSKEGKSECKGHADGKSACKGHAEGASTGCAKDKGKKESGCCSKK